ncbi:ATP-binding protein [Limihaloglobus sulfuriphilus]|nr:ATP-binding protein [Limihaloglobus sulfuriphilus]
MKTVSKTLELRYPVKYTRLYESILSELDESTYSPEDRFALELVLDEAITNAVKHGNKNDPDKKVTVSYSITPKQFEIEITDEGPGFEIEDLPDPRREENLFKTSGRGVLLMKAYMDKVKFNKKGNSVRMVKRAANYHE